TYSTSAGVDGSGCIKSGSQSYFDDDDWEDVPLYDLLVTPAVSGKVSIEVKKPEYGSSSISFYKVSIVDGVLKRGAKITLDEDPELLSIDYTTVELPEISEPTMIGIRADNVYIDNFHADNVELDLTKGLTLSSVVAGQATGKVDCDENNQFTVSATVKVKNTGELDLTPGEEGYTVRLLLMKKDASGNYVVDRVVAQKAVDQTLAVGAESGEIVLSGTLEDSSVTPEEGATSNGHRYDVDECITNTSKILGNYEAVPYQPIPALSDANGKAIEADGEINMGIVKGGDTYTVSLANNGAAPMNVTSVTVTGDLCTLSGENSFNVAKHESKEVELTVSSSVTGEKEGTITFSGEGFEPLTYTLKGNVLDPSLWFVNFEDGKIPDDMIALGEWTADN
ncbi:MAG: hypothetical protein K2H18_08170, partial [Muribaculaceae bacterium]|nr:hypothetical protein [Muribaculaceae bacterium]